MDGPARTVVLVTILAALAFLGLNARPGASAAADRRIAVLTSHDTVPYQEALAGFRQYLSQYGKAVSSEVYPLQGDAA
jgi:hypothetical protein